MEMGVEKIHSHIDLNENAKQHTDTKFVSPKNKKSISNILRASHLEFQDIKVPFFWHDLWGGRITNDVLFNNIMYEGAKTDSF